MYFYVFDGNEHIVYMGYVFKIHSGIPKTSESSDGRS